MQSFCLRYIPPAFCYSFLFLSLLISLLFLVMLLFHCRSPISPSFCSFSLSTLSHSFVCVLSSLFKTFLWPMSSYTDKKENKIFLIYKKIQRDREQSHICLTTSSYMVKYLRISSHIRKPFRMYDYAPDPI